MGICDLPMRKRKTRKRKGVQGPNTLSCKRLVHRRRVYYFSWIACGLLFFTVTCDGSIHFWNPSTGTCLRKVHHGGPLTDIQVSSSMAFRPTLVTKCNGVTRVWRIDLTRLRGSRRGGGGRNDTVHGIERQSGLFTLVRVMGRNLRTCISDCDLEGADVSRDWTI